MCNFGNILKIVDVYKNSLEIKVYNYKGIGAITKKKMVGPFN